MNENKIIIIDALRCYLSMIITIVHANFFIGGIVYKSTSYMLNYIKRVPILGFISNNPFPVDIFWITSGFFCQLKLLSIHNDVDDDVDDDDDDDDDENNNNTYTKTTTITTTTTKERYKQILKNNLIIFINRIIRLYPLYALQVFYNYHTNNELCNTNIQIFHSLTFFIFSPSGYSLNSPCVSIGWTSAVDMHGYAILIILSLFFLSSKKKRRYRMYEWSCFLLYAYSVYNLITNTLALVEEYKHNMIVQELLNGKRLWNGVDLLSLDTVRYYNGDNNDMISMLLHSKDDDEEQLIEAKIFLRLFKSKVYYTGIFSHGGVMFLGALLGLNWYNYIHNNNNNINANNKSTTMIWIRAIIGILILYISGGFLHFLGLPFYWILRALLQLEYDIQNMNHHNKSSSSSSLISSFKIIFYNLFTIPIWKHISKYTYGIYLIHMHVLRYTNIEYFKNNINLKQNYILFYLSRALKIWIISLILSIILYHSIEMPFIAVRKKYFGLSSNSRRSATRKEKVIKKAE